MKIIVGLIFTLFQFRILAQDIEIIEERNNAEIKLFAINNTDNELDATITVNISGFTTADKNPFKRILLPKAKEVIMTLTTPPNTECEYSTSISYKKAKKVNIASGTSDTPISKRRTTSIQMNASKVNVFTQDGCARCEFVVAYLEKNNIPYVELNTSAHDPNQDLMFSKLQEVGFKENTVQMPVIVNNGKTDYNIKDLQKYVALLK